MKDTLILKDGSQVELESGASLSTLTVLSVNKEDFVTLWDKFTEDNLSEVTVKNGSDVVIANYTNLILVNETSTITEKGVLTSFNVRQMTDTEIELLKVKERLESLEESQTVQDDAIDGLATIVSDDTTSTIE